VQPAVRSMVPGVELVVLMAATSAVISAGVLVQPTGVVAAWATWVVPNPNKRVARPNANKSTSLKKPAKGRESLALNIKCSCSLSRTLDTRGYLHTI